MNNLLQPNGNLLEQSKSLEWIWQGQKRNLGDLHYHQLRSILNTLNKLPNSRWFGKEDKIWRFAIKEVIKNRYPSKFGSLIIEEKYRNIERLIINKFPQLK